MAFKIGNNSVNKRVTLEQLTQGLDAVKDKKKIDRITLIFNKYNTNTNNGSADSLDLNEQVALMNDYHKADAKGDDFDGKISRRSLKKAGLKGEYKAYRDFMEAYQKAVGTDNTFDLTFKDDTVDGNRFVETTAQRKGTVDGQEFIEEHSYVNNDKAKLTFQTAEGTFSYDPQGHLTRQTTADNQTILYKAYTSNAKNAPAGVIVVRDKDNNRTELQLQEDGTYLNKQDNKLYTLNDKAIPEEYTTPEPPVEEPAPQVIKKPSRPTTRKLIRMTAGWKNQKFFKPDDDSTRFNEMSKAEEVLDKLIEHRFKYAEFSKESLLADLIKNNPSVFNSEGIIYNDAQWAKLDFPKDLSKYGIKSSV